MVKILRQVLNRHLLLYGLLFVCVVIILNMWFVCDQKSKEEKDENIDLSLEKTQQFSPKPKSKAKHKSKPTPTAKTRNDVSKSKTRKQGNKLKERRQKNVPKTSQQNFFPIPEAKLPTFVPTSQPEAHTSEHFWQNDVSSGVEKIEKRKTKTVVETLTELLEKKLSLPAVSKVNLLPDPCLRKDILGNSCNKKCLRMKISNNPGERVDQIVTIKRLKLTPTQKRMIQEMSRKVPGNYDVVIATGASSNHFNESQAFLKNLHDNVFPHLTNFTLIYYNLGLTDSERSRLVKYCRCHVVDFPFDKFPSARKIRCYTWKPVIIRAHIDQANVFMWMDSSVRFNKNPDRLQQAIKRTRERGLHLPGPVIIPSSVHAMTSIYHFFGDEPCAYFGMGEIGAGSGFYANEYLVKRLVLEPWAACAFNPKCMCPSNHPTHRSGASDRMYQTFRAGAGPIVYGLVHRFDQSALNILVHKIYYDRYKDVLFSRRRDGIFNITRGHKEDYLPAS